MTSLLQYLLPLIVAVTFSGNSDIPDTVVEPCHASVCADSHEFYPPRPTSFASTQRSQTTARRSGGLQRNPLEFIKAGRVINAGLRYFIQRNSLLTYSNLAEPSFRLLRLGKLII